MDRQRPRSWNSNILHLCAPGRTLAMSPPGMGPLPIWTDRAPAMGPAVSSIHDPGRNMNRQRPPTMDQQRTPAKPSGGSLTCRRRNRCFCIDRPEKYCLYGILDGILLNHLYIILFVILLFGFETCSILPPNHRRRLPVTTAGNRLLRLDSFLQNRKAVLPFPADPTSPAETPPPRALSPRAEIFGAEKPGPP